jgi:hypothetical protein
MVERKIIGVRDFYDGAFGLAESLQVREVTVLRAIQKAFWRREVEKPIQQIAAVGIFNHLERGIVVGAWVSFLPYLQMKVKDGGRGGRPVKVA